MDIKGYYKLLEDHDWYHTHSEDNTVYHAGLAEKKQLLSLAISDRILEQMFRDYSEYILGEGRDKPKMESYL